MSAISGSRTRTCRPRSSGLDHRFEIDFGLAGSGNPFEEGDAMPLADLSDQLIGGLCAGPGDRSTASRFTSSGGMHLFRDRLRPSACPASPSHGRRRCSRPPCARDRQEDAAVPSASSVEDPLPRRRDALTVSDSSSADTSPILGAGGSRAARRGQVRDEAHCRAGEASSRRHA